MYQDIYSVNIFVCVHQSHVLQDCHAMGAEAQTALAIATVPYGLDSKMEEELFQMLAGALPVLQAAGCALVGGHTCEGQEASLGELTCMVPYRTEFKYLRRFIYHRNRNHDW